MSISPDKMGGAQNKRRDAERMAGNGQAGSSQGPAAYDGPNDPPARGRAGSNAGSDRFASRRPGSRSGSQNREAQMQTARSLQRPAQEVTQILKNVDFGGNAYNIFTQVSHNIARSVMHSQYLFRGLH